MSALMAVFLWTVKDPTLNICVGNEGITKALSMKFDIRENPERIFWN